MPSQLALTPHFNNVVGIYSEIRMYQILQGNGLHSIHQLKCHTKNCKSVILYHLHCYVHIIINTNTTRERLGEYIGKLCEK
jgi:hypothetical protein